MNDALDSAQSIFFDAIASHAPGEWPAYLGEACGGNAELRRRVERLLEAHVALGSIHAQAAPAKDATLDHPSAERPGTQIGPYKLLEQIGEGGFGIVFMAEQAAPVRRKVALKILKPGMDTRQVVARFEAERQALALMDHPSIAHVFDGGATPSGRPYFVMELVRGVPITEFCDQNQLAPRQRLELFIPVCQAVQHAHQKGIIHRDLKPSNILVVMHDTTPVVKVIDFGVAKALGQQLTDKTLFTGFAQLVGTPLYMSPEQAGQSGLDIDTRSDIFSLGVLLYELLTGTTPFNRERFKLAAFDEILRIIREEEPPKPSTRLSELDTAPALQNGHETPREQIGSRSVATTTLASVAAFRGTEPAKLTKLVRGELDWIVMKALEKDRNRRYETANGFAADIQHYLNDEAVVACPPSTTYRLRKFTRRHRVPLTVAAAFLLLLVAGAVVSTYQAIRIRAEQENTLAQKLEADRQRNRAERERDRAVAAEQKALTEARKSEQVAAFMTDMLNGVGPSVALGRDTAMLREILDRTTRRLDQMKGQPAVEADLRTVLGGVYYDLGDYQIAEEMHRAALVLRRELLGSKHADVARSLVSLGEALRKQARFDDAKRLFTEALSIQRELLPEGDPAIGLTLFHLGMVYNVMWNGAEAEGYFREALVIARHHSHWSIAGVLDQLALSLTYQRKYSEAEPFARECVEMRRKQSPSGGPGLATALHNLGFLLREHGRVAEAEPFFREALEIRRKCLGRYHQEPIVTLIIFSESLRRQGNLEEAAQLACEVIALSNEPASPADLRRFAGSAYGVLASVRSEQGRTDEAIAANRKVIELKPKHGHGYNGLAWLLATCADVRFRDPSEAVNLAKKAVELTPNGWAFVNTLGVAHYRAGDYAAAIEALERSMKGRDGGDSFDWFFLAMAHWQLGEEKKAREFFDRALQWMDKHQPTNEELLRFRAEAAELLAVENKKD